MDLENLNALLRFLVFVFSVPAIIISFGVVWRVEKKLDLAFKLFLTAFILFFLSESFLVFSDTFLSGREEYYRTTSLFLKLFFTGLFFFGMLEMRSLINKVEKDIEKESEKKQKTR